MNLIMKLAPLPNLGLTFAAIALLTACGVGGAAEAQGDRGLKIGEQAPEFKLKDQDGKERALSEFFKKGKVALVFYRSADW